MQPKIAHLSNSHSEPILGLESDTAAFYGKFASASELTRRAIDAALRSGHKETAALDNAHRALREAYAGNLSLAKQETDAALKLANGWQTEGISAVALGLVGDSAQAAKLAGDLRKRFPEDTMVRFEYLPMIQAAIALRGGDPGKAVDDLAAAAPHELAWLLFPDAVYFRAEAYLSAKNGVAAQAEFQKILDHPGIVLNDPVGAMAQLGPGRRVRIGWG